MSDIIENFKKYATNKINEFNINLGKDLRKEASGYADEGVEKIIQLKEDLINNHGFTSNDFAGVHNNAIDAFKHAYQHAKLASIEGYNISSIVGFRHELEPYTPGEARMDIYNNEVGRRIGLEVEHDILNDPNNQGKTKDELQSLIDEEIKNRLVQKLIDKDLITTPISSIDNRKIQDLFPLDTYISPDGDIFRRIPLNSGNEAIDGISGSPLELFNPISGLYDLLDQLEDLYGQARYADDFADPLLIDLDGDGIETTNLASNPAFFDLDKSGFAEATGWVDTDDGVLALDRNNDGIINDGSELFGDNTVLSSGQTATTGFQALSDLDSNSDGKIDINDAQFANLKVVKGDGNVYSLQELGIKSLNLNYTTTNTVDEAGNTQARLGNFTKEDNTTGQMGDYLLDFNDKKLAA